MNRMVLLAVVVLAVAAVPVVWVVAFQGSGGTELDDAKIIFEINSTDGDAGIQIFLDGEGWNKMTVVDPTGTQHLELAAQSGIGAQGLTEFFFESAEPTFDEQPLVELLARFPEGEYSFLGETVDGDEITGSAELTHDLPAGPVTSPAAGATVDVSGPVQISWEEVTAGFDGSGEVDVVSYQVIVVQEEPVVREFSVDMPADARSVTVPPEFFEPDATYKYEVLAVEASGNQTITEVEFDTE